MLLLSTISKLPNHRLFENGIQTLNSDDDFPGKFTWKGKIPIANQQAQEGTTETDWIDCPPSTSQSPFYGTDVKIA